MKGWVLTGTECFCSEGLVRGWAALSGTCKANCRLAGNKKEKQGSGNSKGSYLAVSWAWAKEGTSRGGETLGNRVPDLSSEPVGRVIY